ncbi:MAG TPA: DUF4160 domain-containing protein [Flavobacteriales bacterium]|nr:DUF4160 domain-containing protein [Flavobacteriales bacterium]HMR29072.1 DUF4160 domain-containing protein [Flavobacteriales bacterium]
MPELCRFYGIIIRMYFMDHNPPHFHAEYQGQRAEFDIRTLELIAGGLPSRAHALVLEWAALHRQELLANWKLAVEGELPSPIDPLP